MDLTERMMVQVLGKRASRTGILSPDRTGGIFRYPRKIEIE